MAGWGKLSVKDLKSNKIMILFEYHRFDWLLAPHTPNTQVKISVKITLYEFN